MNPLIGVSLVGFSLLFSGKQDLWDPSQASIVFSRLSGEFWQIWALETESGAERQITETSGDKRFPNLSPDGRFLFYVDGSGVLTRMDRQGEFASVLDAQAPLSEPALSADGQFAFMKVRREGAYQTEVWTAGLDGKDSRKLTHPPLRQMQARWSADGRKLAFIEFDPREKIHALIVCNADGSVPETVLRGKERLASPAWSPDGKLIAFSKEVSGNHDLWLFDRASKQARQLTFHPDLDYAPVFSPDGASIGFISRRSGTLDLWKTSVAGGNPKPITRGGKPCRDPFWYQPRPSARIAIGGVTLDKRSIRTEKREPVSLAFSLSEKARVQLEIFDSSGAKVEGGEPVELNPGAHTLSWNGSGLSGAPLVAGCYSLQVRAWNESGVAIWNPKRETGGQAVRIPPLDFDKAGKKIRFVLPSPARVRVRAGLEEGPMLATLWDWKAHVAGPVEISYSGDLPNPWGNFWDRPDAKALVWAYTLADNAVVIEGESPPQTFEEDSPSVYAGAEREIEPHARHAPYLCRDPRLKVDLAEDFPRDEAGLPLVADRLTLRIDAPSEAERAIAENLRFEVILYIDGQFLLEDEDSLLPFHYPLDVSRFSEGEHTILVNLANFQDHVGAAFFSFRIQRGSR